jgi:hypothetical protein
MDSSHPASQTKHMLKGRCPYSVRRSKPNMTMLDCDLDQVSIGIDGDSVLIGEKTYPGFGWRVQGTCSSAGLGLRE